MTIFPLTHANQHVPGATTYAQHYYGGHPFENLQLWRPDDWDVGAGFKNKPLLVSLHGGLGNTAGNVSMQVGGGGFVETLHNTEGWPVISLEYPSVSDNSELKQEWGHSHVWPFAMYSVARALSYLKANAVSDGYNDAEALWGVDGNGDVNSIDPNQIVVSGFSYGATLAFLMAAMPSSVFRSQELDLEARPHDWRLPHHPRAVIGVDGQIDWTQFSFNPTVVTGTYRDNVHQVFTRRLLEKRLWGDTYLSPGQVTKAANAVPMRVKRGASPWYWASRAHPESLQVAVMGKWDKVDPSDPDQDNLTYLDWAPGSQRLEEDLGKAWYSPHRSWQAKPYQDLLASLGVEHAILWGSSTTNPAPGLNLDDESFNPFAENWLLNTLGLG